MPVSTGAAVAAASSSTADRAKRCKHCEESGHRLDSGNLFWRIQLDQDLLDTIIAIYPEWFKDYNLSRVGSTMAEGGSGGSGAAPDTGHTSGGQPSAPNSTGLLPLSPPKSEVDDSPLQKSMDKNKESLKVKLMLRRPINQLVAQGIMPPLKTPPAFHEQRQKLERAKMGDLLKAKIQQRPDRQELVRQHILEADMGHVDPSLAERQRMLKKARLADSLNDQLSHRPGPLELIKKNILHTEEPIERAVKEGVIPFKATCEGQLTKPQHPNRYITFEEDSQSSEGAQSPLQTQSATSVAEVRQQSNVLEAAAASAGIVTVALTIPTTGGAVVVTSASPAAFEQAVAASASSSTDHQQQQTATVTFADLCNNVMGGNAQLPAVTSATASLPTILPLAPTPSPMSLGSTTSSLSPLSSVSVSSPPAPPTPSPALTITPRPAPQSSPISTVSSHRSDAPGKDKNRKKSKSKSQPKTRTIKFHEYKGPPNAHKSTAMSAVSPVETSYELLLQQQQLFLQWQLEWQHKYPQIILPAAQKPLSVSSDSLSGGSAVTATSLSGLIAVASPSAAQTHTVANTATCAAPTVTVAAPSSNTNLGVPVLSPATPHPPTPQAPPTPQQEQPQQQTLRTLTKLEDMKVSDLKAELKKRNLPVSGSKPQLIERLKPFSDSLTGSSQQQDSHVMSIASTSVLSTTTSTTTTTAAATIPVTQMGHILMDTPGPVINEESLSGLSMETPVSPSTQQMTLMHDGSGGDDEVSLPTFSPSSQHQQLSPISQNMSPDSVGIADLDMDTAEGNSLTMGSPSEQQASPPPPSPQQQPQNLVSEDIIRDQQRKIEELERELLKSQLQLQQIRSSKELSNTQRLKQQQQALVAPSTSLSNGVIDPASATAAATSAAAASKQQKLKQHLVQKIHQQQLQMQLQQLQTLQQQQQQQRQQQQQQHIAFQQQQQGLNAKASLAAFLQSQSQQQQIANLLQQQQQQSAVNNKNNNNNNNNNNSSNNNNKRNSAKSIVLGQQQAAIVLNQLNLQKQKASVLNGVSGHQRTSSLPNFFGSFVTQQQHSMSSSKEASPSASLAQTGSDPQQFLVTKPPPQYEEATKQLKVKQEADTNSSGTKSTSSRPKNVKSQIVDDVLEILIKNGELPPSAAQDPATPTTPGRSMPQGLVFTSSADTAENPTPATSPAVPPPPPPPPLPHTTFAITLPTAISVTSHANTSPFHMQFSGSDSLDFILDNVEGNASISGDCQQQGSQNHPLVVGSDLQGPPPGIDLKELGLDLETLDPMDFGQLDCGDLGVPVVKVEPSDLLDPVTDMEIGGVGGETSTSKLGEHQACELMDIGEMPMDMDDADWLESLMPPTDASAGGSGGDVDGGTSVMMSSHQSSFLSPSSNQGSLFHFSHNHLHNGHHHAELESYDPLLSNSQDPFDLFNIEESEFKMAGDLNAALGWGDRVDFAT